MSRRSEAMIASLWTFRLHSSVSVHTADPSTVSSKIQAPDRPFTISLPTTRARTSLSTNAGSSAKHAALPSTRPPTRSILPAYSTNSLPFHLSGSHGIPLLLCGCPTEMRYAIRHTVCL